MSDSEAAFWKVVPALAALVLAILLFTYKYRDNSPINEPSLITDTVVVVDTLYLHDTIYVNKRVKPTHKDTIYLNNKDTI